jgi:ECF sigma factor
LGGCLAQLPPKTVSKLLANWHAGDDEALRAAVPLVYDELRRAAHHYLHNERPGHTLQSTALVHEAYLRLEKQGAAEFQNREHFLDPTAG